jgi:hypothetical protein
VHLDRSIDSSNRTLYKMKLHSSVFIIATLSTFDALSYSPFFLSESSFWLQKLIVLFSPPPSLLLLLIPRRQRRRQNGAVVIVDDVIAVAIA